MKLFLFTLIPLAFFCAGVFFAGLFWGKYRQLVAALREKLHALEVHEAELNNKLTQSQKQVTDIKTTCRTLEDELTYIAKDRDEAKAEAEHLQTKLNVAGRDAKEVTAQKEELKTIQVSLQAADNKVAEAMKEKERHLKLVTKLQHELSKLGDTQKQLRAKEKTIATLESQQRRQQRRARGQREQSFPTLSSPVLPGSRSRLTRRQKQSIVSRQKPVKPAALVSEPGPNGSSKVSSTNGSATNGHATEESRGGLLSALGRRLRGENDQEALKRASNGSRRHW